MLSGTPGPRKSKWSSSMAPSTSAYSSVITAAGSTPECFGRAVNDIGDSWECASGQRKSVRDSTSGAAPRLEQRSKCPSQARLLSNSSFQNARKDGLPNCIREKRQRITPQRGERKLAGGERSEPPVEDERGAGVPPV